MICSVIIVAVYGPIACNALSAFYIIELALIDFNFKQFFHEFFK